MKRGLLVSIMVALAALASLGVVVANNSPQPTYDIRLIVAHDPAPPYYMQAMKHFADTVEAETNNHVRVQVLTSRQYGTIDTASLRNALIEGKFEMSAATVSSLGYIDSDFWVYEMPYMFDSYAQVSRTIDGPIGQRLMDKLPAYGLHGLAYTFSGGYKIVCSNTKAIHTPSDLVGVNVLTTDPVNINTFETLGAKVTKGSYREAKQLMGNGKVQVSEMTFTRLHEYGLHTKYVSELDHSFFLTTMVINEAFYQKLPAAYRDVLSKAAKQVALEERTRTLQENQVIRQEYAAKGIKINHLTDAEKDKFRQATQSAYTKCAHLFSDGLVSQIRALRVATR